MSRSILGPALILVSLLLLPGCKTPSRTESTGYGRYTFDLLIERDATAGFVCIASVTDLIGNSSLRTKPFRAMPGKPALGFVDEPVTGSRLEATVTVDPTASRATYSARVLQPKQRTITFEATRNLPKD